MSKIFYHALGVTEKWPKISAAHPASLAYDDVLLVPQISDIASRSHVDTSVEFGPYKLEKPLISAPMDTISGEKMIRALASLGAIGTLPRDDIEVNSKICRKLSDEEIPCVYAIGIKNALNDAKILHNSGAKVILIDIAHGGLKKIMEVAKEIKQRYKFHVIAGNIVTYEEAIEYKKAKVDIARVGVGAGGLCTTRLVAGSGLPQLSAVFETTSANISVIADQSIRKPGDFAKAIAAGATIAMVGSLFAGCDETPGEIKNGKKIARGQASQTYMKDNGVVTGEFRTAEGITLEVPVKGPVGNVVNELMGGLRSAMTYAGARDIREFQEKAVFSLVSPSVRDENKPWLKDVR